MPAHERAHVAARRPHLQALGARVVECRSHHLLPWSPPQVAEEKSLLDLLSERDRKTRIAEGVRPVQSAPGEALLGIGTAFKEPPSTVHKPVLGTLGTPLGKFSLVSEKLDDKGQIKGLDFMRLEVPGWDIGVKGSKLKISHKWGAKSGASPFRDPEKRKTKLPK